ncbi:MAG: endonuclease III [Bacteroidales bacterium]|jgi:endonuclease-3|nr:endonuclease III [Bacteroidales bacterium]
MIKLADRYQNIITLLNIEYPNAGTELHYHNPFELLVAVILSAQCTDKRVNTVTPALFQKFPDALSMAQATADDIFPYIKSISYPNAKARNLHLMAKRLVETFHSVVPENTKDLETLAGVGRKTANVIASVVFHQSKMPVDTHVHRVSARIGLTHNAKNVLQTEDQLMHNLKDKYDIALLHHQLILHGRYVCKARKPLCEKCTLTRWCRFYSKNYRHQVL